MATNCGTDNAGFESLGDSVQGYSSLLSLQPWISMERNCQRGEEKLKVNRRLYDTASSGETCFIENLFPEIAPQNVMLGSRHRRCQKPLRTRRARRYSVKSVSPVESHLISQCYGEDFGIEDYTFTATPVSTEYARPLVITDGSRIISRSSSQQPASEHFEDVIKEGIAGDASKFVNGWSSVSYLPMLRTPKRKSRETPRENIDILSTRRSRKTSDSKDGLEMIRIFSLGLAIGVISSILFNKEEVKKLNNLLSSKDNLIQDLQEELEMIQSLTVKELDNAVCYQKPNDYNARMEVHFDSSENQLSVSYIPTVVENVRPAAGIAETESLSKMEEELKAELERLDMNMGTSCLDASISVIKDLDPDFVVDVVHGEIKVDTHCNPALADGNSSIESKCASPNHTYNANYAVSPRELSVRLNEVIQLRLEERIKELEQTLQQSQKQLEAGRNFSVMDFSSSDIVSSSNPASPAAMRDHTFTQPIHLNLHGGAMDAYDEAYDEFMRIAEEESMMLTTNTSNQSGYSLYSSDRSLGWGMEGDKDSSFHSQECHENDECDDQYDDECRMLIQQILEKTKQGSSAVLHAQRMLLATDY